MPSHKEIYGWDTGYFPRLANIPSDAPQGDGDYLLRKTGTVFTWELDAGGGGGPNLPDHPQNDGNYVLNVAGGIDSWVTLPAIPDIVSAPQTDDQYILNVSGGVDAWEPLTDYITVPNPPGIAGDYVLDVTGGTPSWEAFSGGGPDTPNGPSEDGDYYLQRSSGVFTWESLFIPTLPTVRAIEVENDTAFDANQAAGVRSVWSSTNQIMVANSGFTVAAAGITVPVTGVYRCSINLYMTPGAARTNVRVRPSVNGTAQRASAAHSYIRAASGHNESSANLACLLSLTAGDVVGVHTAQLSSDASAMTVAIGDGTLSLEFIG